ncbi:hypothetical protein ABMA28_008181 [Loxostege sticticalis]|uniref:FP protein C-terminal domain-containing protein n=1 Tax=Loxostege sticticalis TaxID=481309 RepID=A0ABD0SGP5_LOXSC
MSTARSPPVRFGSHPELHHDTTDDNTFNRKRKQPDDDGMDLLLDRKFEIFESKWEDWSSQMKNMITNSIAETVKTSISAELTKISCMMNDMNVSLQKLSSENTVIRESLSEMQTRVNELKNCVDVIEKKVSDACLVTDKVTALQTKLDMMEQQARECNIEISNLPERRNENLLSLVEQLGTVIKVPIPMAQVTSVHRVPHATSNNNRPKNVIVKLASRILRDNVVAASRLMKGRLTSNQLSIQGTVHNIYVNEHLTLRNKLLFRSVREEAKKNSYKYVWVKHGVILVRKSDTSPIQAIRNEQEISKIK